MNENRQIPRGPKHLKCPFWKKSMHDVCHTCPLWAQVRFKNREGQFEDRWDCALGVAPVLMIDLIRCTNQTTASVDKVANEVNAEQNVQKQGFNALAQILLDPSTLKMIGDK